MKHNELTFVHRTNIKNENSKIDTNAIHELYEKNLISMNIRDNEKEDIDNWNLLRSNQDVKKVSGYVKQFHNLYLASQENDVLVYAKFLGYQSKLGLVKKGSKIKEIKKDRQTFFCLELSNVRNIDKSDFPLLETVIPYYSTVSKVDKGREKLLSIYYEDYILPMKLENLSAKATELLCVEWLRSEFNNISKISYQLMPTGGNNSTIDFLGKTADNKVMAAQITTSKSIKTIKNKIDKLELFNADYRVMFGQLEDFDTKKVTYVPINRVWDNLINSKYNGLIDFLINK